MFWTLSLNRETSLILTDGCMADETMKGSILNILRAEAKGAVSGDRLSAELRISEDTLHKHISELRELGYPIAETAEGYLLADSPDALFPWEFPGRESRIHYFPEATSTMDIAKALAGEGCPAFTVVIAGCQRGGRGRLERRWHSSEGGLYFTMVTRPQMPPALSFRINFSASVALVRTFQRMFDIKAMVKWPNDILVDDKKLAGMLSEMKTEDDRVSYVNIGIGINLNNDPTPYEANATSLKQLLGREVSRREILSEFLDEFEARMNEGNFDNVISEWKTCTLTLGRQVRVATVHDVSEGFATDVDENGALVLTLEDGSAKKVVYGDCFHQM